MSITEFDNGFEVLYNNITSNQAPGLNIYEKSIFLTKAQNEIVKNHFSAVSKGNTLGQGFDDSAKRQADFSVLMKTSQCEPISEFDNDGHGIIEKYICTYSSNTKVCGRAQIKFTKEGEPYSVPTGTYTIAQAGTPTVTTITVSSDTVTVHGYPFGSANGGTLQVAPEYVDFSGQIDDRSSVWCFPSDAFIPVNETVKTEVGNRLQVVPLRYDEYLRLMSKPYKRPVKNQAWRLMNSGIVATGNTSTKYIELIAGPNDTVDTYTVRYIRKPKPIILGDLEGLTIDGYSYAVTPSTALETDGNCELDPMLHEEILQRAVELAKAAWTSTGQDNMNAVLQAGQRSE